MKKLILASTSPYRLEQLQQIGLDPMPIDPQVDERAYAESDDSGLLAERLARAKAKAVFNRYKQENLVVIAGDQTASVEGRQLHKPGNRDGAIAQLRLCSAKQVQFNSSVCVITPQLELCETTGTLVRFRKLTEQQLRTYVEKEQPFDCAGSFKCEGLGIVLFERIESYDPSALVGLPLIALTTLLKKVGYYPLDYLS